MKTRKVLDIDTMTIYHNVLLTLQLVLLEKLIMPKQSRALRLKWLLDLNLCLVLFNQFKYIPLKACPLVLELELVSNFTDCIVSPDVSGDFPASESAPNTHQSTSGEFELNNCFLQCDVVSLDNDVHNKYVAHLLDGKELPITYNTYICQSNSVVGQATINTTVVRSVSKLTAAFITFYKADTTGGATEVHKEYNRFLPSIDKNNLFNSRKL